MIAQPSTNPATVRANQPTARLNRADAGIALCLFALLFSVYLFTFSGVYHSSDEMSMLVATDSLARRGEWDIELLRWMGEQQGSFGDDGHLYSRKGIGTTLAAWPTYWLALQSSHLGNVQAAMLTNGLVTALTGVLVYLVVRQLGYGPGPGLGVALAFGVGTMAWPYARYLFSESLASLGLMASFYFLLCHDARAASPAKGRGREVALPLLAGAGLGLALLARLNNAIVAPFLGLLLLFYLYQRHGKDWRAWIRPVVLFGLPVVATLAVTGWYNWLRFGSPLTTGYLPEERFATPFFEGFYGLTLSPGKGLLWYNPLLFAALAGWPAFFRRHRAAALLVAAVVLGNVAFYAPWYLWWAGHGWGARFLVTLLPFATLSLAPVLEAARNRRGLTIALGTLAAASLGVQLLGVAADFDLYLEDIYAELGLYHPDTLFKPAYSPLVRQIAYLHPENLDLAWARGDSPDWRAMGLGLALVLVSGLALGLCAARKRWAARHKRWRVVAGGALVLLLGLGATGLLLLYAPSGDVAEAARALAAMERPGESALVANPLHTEAFQDAYDGRLELWGVPSEHDVRGEFSAFWLFGAGSPEPAAARFQLGSARLDLRLPRGDSFDAVRLPVAAWDPDARLGDAVKLVAVQLDGRVLHPGDELRLTLYWRALASMDTSYTAFVQVIDYNGKKIAQVDHLPCGGGCPTTTWRPGDLVGERYDLPVQVDALPGHYQIIVGMYDLETGENLTWFDDQGNPSGPALSLGAVEVLP
jgi:hypothetical protein